MMIRTTALLSLLAVAPLGAQWLNYPTAGIPRTPDGKPNLSAPAPKTADGKPDIGGLWLPPAMSVGNIAKNLKPDDIAFTPSAAALYQHRQDTLSKEDPTGNCIPGGVPRSDLVGYPYKIVPSPGMVMILYEAVHSYRQIFTDGRKLPKDPSPSWQGNSVGHWEGDTFVVESNGFNENSWLDNGGHPGTEALHVIERFHRTDFGHLELKITVEDPRSYTKPFTASYVLTLQADNELLEYVCNENNKDVEHLVGK
jgi:hypothetical protein